MPEASLLFAPGARPGRAALRALSEGDGGFAISLDPLAESAAPTAGASGEETWLELLASGLTFDLVGLAPGDGAQAPPARHAFGLPADFQEQRFEAVTLRPGPHLAGGEAMLPVIRCLAWLAARLATLPGTQAVVWHAARCWSAPQPFRAGVQRWVEGGAFPGLSLAALADSPDGAMQSEGLSLFIGQELRLEPDLLDDRAAGGKLALRLMHWLVESGPLTAPQSLTGPDGQALRIEPSSNGRFVRVWKN